jgi:hypothetical protein
MLSEIVGELGFVDGRVAQDDNREVGILIELRIRAVRPPPVSSMPSGPVISF